MSLWLGLLFGALLGFCLGGLYELRRTAQERRGLYDQFEVRDRGWLEMMAAIQEAGPQAAELAELATAFYLLGRRTRKELEVPPVGGEE